MQKVNLSFLISVLILYFGLCGGLWHLGFWSTFDINFLQYINLTDIIKSFVFPFITATGYVLIGFIATTLANYHDRLDNPESLVFGMGSNTPFGKFLNKNVEIIVFLYIFGITVFAITGGQIKYLLIPFLIASPLSIYLTNRNYLFKSILSPDLRSAAITFVIILPLMSFCFAKMQSLDIYENKSFKKIVEIGTNDSENIDNILGLKYLGSTSSQAFLTDSANNQITILNMSITSYIKYQKVTKTNKIIKQH